jgi:hypothetical protein
MTPQKTRPPASGLVSEFADLRSAYQQEAFKGWQGQPLADTEPLVMPVIWA